MNNQVGCCGNGSIQPVPMPPSSQSYTQPHTLSLLMSPMSLFFSCATRLWCILWKSRSFRNLSHVADAFAAISLALFSSRRSAETSSSRSCQKTIQPMVTARKHLCKCIPPCSAIHGSRPSSPVDPSPRSSGRCPAQAGFPPASPWLSAHTTLPQTSRMSWLGPS